ncbi:MAG: bifunctional precorrin-2 dehydrogenase/sirohydrochlorin ferrochelatase [Lacibacter sp.]
MQKTVENKNQLYPVFLKLNDLQTLLVGAGNVGLEKLHSILSNSPEASVTVVAPSVKQDVKDLLEKHPSCSIIERTFEYSDLEKKDLIILATDDKELHQQIRAEARKRSLLINVADTPVLCDFYLGSIVQKGYVKLAISTNGMSPTISKRLKEVLNDVLPDELDEVIEQLNEIRNSLKGDFAEKVQKLNEITKQLTTRD